MDFSELIAISGFPNSQNKTYTKDQLRNICDKLKAKGFVIKEGHRNDDEIELWCPLPLGKYKFIDWSEICT